MARMGISLPNAYVRGKRKTMIRKRSLTNATRKTINILKNLMVKLILIKNGTQVMRVSNQKVTTWKS
jgi:hypothetical protein